MTGSKRNEPGAPMRIEVTLKGDQRLAENVIVEARALAERLGLEIPTAKVTRKNPARRRAANAKSGAKHRS